MSALDECLQFDCAGERLVGVLSRPAQPSGVGVVVVVGGPQYRVGSHRQFVLLARHLAAAGHAVLRFDYRGMGDSGGERRDFEAVSDDIAAAIHALRQAVPTLRQVALWGLCDGASAALLYLHATSNASVAGLCLLNPWVRSTQSQATAQVKHYYTQRLRERAFWTKLLRGQVGLGRLSELFTSVHTMLAARAPGKDQTQAPRSFQHRMAGAWSGFDGDMLLILSGNDLTAKEFIETVAADPAWRGALAKVRLSRLDLPTADHTFSAAADCEAVERATTQWLDKLATPAGNCRSGGSAACPC